MDESLTTMEPEAWLLNSLDTYPSSIASGASGASGAVATGTSAATVPEAMGVAGCGTPAARDFHRAIANSKSGYEIMTD
jgi:hypothetical protein